MSTRYVAVDWSGSLSPGASRTCLAAVEHGSLVTLESAISRVRVVTTLLEWSAAGLRLVVGLDFGFSFPAWHVAALGCSSGPELWALAAVAGESWLKACEPPLWGRPGRRRGTEEQYRRTELEVGGRPKSVFQVGGAGSVGTGSIRGMPALHQLQHGGFTVWPFDGSSGSVVMEIYPRLLTGPGPKSRPQWRQAHLDRLDWPEGGALRSRAALTEDSFDAAVAALRMWQAREDLDALEDARDDIDRIEGRIWEPAAPISSLAT